MGAGKVKLNNGQVVTGQTGGWYDGQQFWNNTLGNAGEFNAQNNQAGQQGAAYVAPQDQPFINQQRQQAGLPAAPSTPPPAPVIPAQPSQTSSALRPSISAPSGPTVPNLQGIYDTAVTAGTKDYQTQFDAVTQAVTAKEMAKNAAVAKIADNPYLSEGEMTGRIAKINSRFNADKQTLLEQQGVLQNQISTAKADAQVKLSIASNQYNIEDQQYQRQLDQVNQYLKAGLLDGASGEDISQIAITTGMSPSMVQSIIDASKKSKEAKPSLQTVDDGTNQYVVAIDDKGNVINKSIIGSSKPTKATGAETTANAKQAKADVVSQVYDTFTKIKGPQGYVSKEDWAKMKSAVLASGSMTAAEFDKEFESFKNPEGADYGYVYN